MNAMKTTEEMLEIARTIAADRATVSLHHAQKQDAIRITGCFADESRSVGMDIARTLFGQPDPETGLWSDRRIGYEYNAPYALVWLPCLKDRLICPECGCDRAEESTYGCVACQADLEAQSSPVE